MDTLEAIRTRRSIRTYFDRPVPEELIRKLLVAAMQTPSARNQQPWHCDLAPDFTRETHDGQQVWLADYRGKSVVVLYYR